MSEDYYIPFEIQSDIMKRLPVKSLVQFRSVSKQWKAFIDSPEFIKKYHINRTNPQHHLLVEYNLDRVPTYTSIVDDHTFPQQKSPLTVPEPLKSLRYSLVGCVDGLLCFCGDLDVDLDTCMVVLWNPSVRKCVGIVIPNVLRSHVGYTRIGFGVCPDTNDPKLVKINLVYTPSLYWEVQVFTLSSRVWKTVFTDVPLGSCTLSFEHVCVDGIIYWSTHGSSIISFDLKSDKFGEVSIPERSVGSYRLRAAKVNKSLGLLEYHKEGEMWVCGVWLRKDDVNNPFTKIYNVNVEGKSVFNSVLGYRNNGEVVLQLDDDDDGEGSHMEVYEPSSGRISSVGIGGRRLTFSVWPYMETLLLLDQSNTIIH